MSVLFSAVLISISVYSYFSWAFLKTWTVAVNNLGKIGSPCLTPQYCYFPWDLIIPVCSCRSSCSGYITCWIVTLVLFMPTVLNALNITPVFSGVKCFFTVKCVQCKGENQLHYTFLSVDRLFGIENDWLSSNLFWNSLFSWLLFIKNLFHLFL